MSIYNKQSEKWEKKRKRYEHIEIRNIICDNSTIFYICMFYESQIKRKRDIDKKRKSLSNHYYHQPLTVKHWALSRTVYNNVCFCFLLNNNDPCAMFNVQNSMCDATKFE